MVFDLDRLFRSECVWVSVCVCIFMCFLLLCVSCRDALDALGLKRYCCRRMLLSHVDLIEKLLNYAPLEKWDCRLTLSGNTSPLSLFFSVACWLGSPLWHLEFLYFTDHHIYRTLFSFSYVLQIKVVKMASVRWLLLFLMTCSLQSVFGKALVCFKWNTFSSWAQMFTLSMLRSQ